MCSARDARRGKGRQGNGANMNGSRYYVVRSEGTEYGIGFGSALAIANSYTTHESILWAIIHGILGWLYVIYFTAPSPPGFCRRLRAHFSIMRRSSFVRGCFSPTFS